MRKIPEGVPDSQASVGIPVGPPPLDGLGLPLEIEVRLHNQLFARGIFTERDARKRLDEIRSSLISALQSDVNRILAIYQGNDAETILNVNGSGSRKELTRGKA